MELKRYSSSEDSIVVNSTDFVADDIGFGVEAFGRFSSSIQSFDRCSCCLTTMDYSYSNGPDCCRTTLADKLANIMGKSAQDY